ncbi:MAG: DUF2975 domain-containing protein [Pseudomonadota bacterium]
MSHVYRLFSAIRSWAYAAWTSVVPGSPPAAADPKRLFRNTRRVIKILWIGSLITVPLGFMAVILVFLAGPESFMEAGSHVHRNAAVTQLGLKADVLLALGSLLVAIPMLRELLRIVDTTLIGDPFIPQNVHSVRKIGWLLLAMTLMLEADWWITEGRPLSPGTLGGLVTVLLVFVLAKVFEKGSYMRAELQETI